MKKVIAFYIFCLIYQWLPAQGVNFGINFTDSGRNLSIQYEAAKRRNEISIGLGINLNNFQQIESREDLYRKKLYATKGYHFANLNFTYQRYILNNKFKCLEPFIFYDFQGKYSTAGNLTTFIEYDSTLVQTRIEQGIIGHQVLNHFGPFWWFENNIGIGFKAILTEKFYIKQRFGIGANLILGQDDQILYRRFSWFDWEFSTLMHFSVGFKMK